MMASHHQPPDNKVIPLRRGLVHLELRTLEEVAESARKGEAVNFHDALRVIETPVKPDLYEQLRISHGTPPSYCSAGRPEGEKTSATLFDELKADWREFASEVRGSPVSHALVAILTVIGWTVLLVAPLLLGMGK